MFANSYLGFTFNSDYRHSNLKLQSLFVLLVEHFTPPQIDPPPQKTSD